MTKTLIALLLMTQPALALCPPAQWDYPYRGKLTVTHDLGQVMARCGPPPFGARVVGCALIGRGTCHVILAPGAGECALRHEIAHCNGWPRDHR
jgi:hypothetical protein